MNPALIGQIIGVTANGALSTTIGLAKDLLNIVQKIASIAFQFNDDAINITRHIGGTYQQSYAVTKALVSETKALSAAYGVTEKQLVKLQEAFTSATGKAAILTQQQKEGLLQVGKFTDEATQGSFIKSLDDMGSSVGTATNAMMGAITKASKMGLSVKEATATVAKNLKLANELSFKNGIDGITKMTMLSNTLKFNLESVKGVADNFTSIEDSINNASKLQLLGGQYASLGANPMQMLYEANNDPEALMERMVKMFSGKGTFDKKTGEVKINPMELQFMKEAAKAAGMNPDDAVNIAKNSVKNRQIDKQLGNVDLTDEQRAFIQNKAQYDPNSGEFKMNSLIGGKMQELKLSDLVAGGNNGLLNDIIQNEALTDDEKVIQASQELVTIGERIGSIMDMIGAYIADLIVPYIPEIASFLQFIPEYIGEKMEGLMSSVQDGSIWNHLLSGIGSLMWGGVKMIGKWLVSIPINIVEGLARAIGGLGKGLWYGAKSMFGFGGGKEAKEGFKESGKGLLQFGKGMLDASMFIPGTGAIGASYKALKAGQGVATAYRAARLAAKSGIVRKGALGLMKGLGGGSASVGAAKYAVGSALIGEHTNDGWAGKFLYGKNGEHQTINPLRQRYNEIRDGWREKANSQGIREARSKYNEIRNNQQKRNSNPNVTYSSSINSSNIGANSSVSYRSSSNYQGGNNSTVYNSSTNSYVGSNGGDVTFRVVEAIDKQTHILEAAIKAKEYDGKVNINGQNKQEEKPLEVKVNDIKINIDGKLTLTTGGLFNSSIIDMNKVLNDPAIVNQLMEVIKDNLARNISGMKITTDTHGMSNPYMRLNYGK